MPLFLRLLSLADTAAARREYLAFAADPAEVERLAGLSAVHSVLLTGLSLPAAEKILWEIRDLGGEGMIGGRVAAADLSKLILVAPPLIFHTLSRRFGNSSGEFRDLAFQIDQLLQQFSGSPRVLEGRRCRFELDRPLIMGVLNVTPDSFSDGGLYGSLDQALRRAEEMAEEGADLIDVGGESTRPGAPHISTAEELDRVLPVIEALRRELGTPLSVDTSKSAVARAAVAAGADFINDISGLAFDAEMATVAGETGAGLFLMHTRGRPNDMQKDTRYDDLMGDIVEYLREGVQRATTSGVTLNKIAVDPGIGFGKDFSANLEILRRLPELRSLGLPVLLGTSRKSFIGKLLNQPDPCRRLSGTLATVVLGVDRGVDIFRVHDVRPAREAAMTAWAVRCQTSSPQI